MARARAGRDASGDQTARRPRPWLLPPRAPRCCVVVFSQFLFQRFLSGLLRCRTHPTRRPVHRRASSVWIEATVVARRLCELGLRVNRLQTGADHCHTQRQAGCCYGGCGSLQRHAARKPRAGFAASISRLSRPKPRGNPPADAFQLGRAPAVRPLGREADADPLFSAMGVIHPVRWAWRPINRFRIDGQQFGS